METSPTPGGPGDRIDADASIERAAEGDDPVDEEELAAAAFPASNPAQYVRRPKVHPCDARGLDRAELGQQA